jgi:hypothetical protein
LLDDSLVLNELWVPTSCCERHGIFWAAAICQCHAHRTSGAILRLPTDMCESVGRERIVSWRPEDVTDNAKSRAIVRVGI